MTEILAIPFKISRVFFMGGATFGARMCRGRATDHEQF